jgi:hypothetical protein
VSEENITHGTAVADERFHAANMISAEQEVLKTHALAEESQKADNAVTPGDNGGDLMGRIGSIGKSLADDGFGSYRSTLANVGLAAVGRVVPGVEVLSSAGEIFGALKNSDPGKFGGMDTMETFGRGKSKKSGKGRIEGGNPSDVAERSNITGDFMRRSGNISRASGMSACTAALNTELKNKISCHMKHKQGFEASKALQKNILAQQRMYVERGMGMGQARALTGGMATLDMNNLSPSGPTEELIGEG